MNFEDGEIDSQAVGGPALKPHGAGPTMKASAASPATASTTEMSLKVRCDLRLIALTSSIEISTIVYFFSQLFKKNFLVPIQRPNFAPGGTAKAHCKAPKAIIIS